MNRSAGVTVIAVLAIVGSAFCIVSAIFPLIFLFLPLPMPPGSQEAMPFLRAIMVVSAFFYFLMATWGILSGIGLFKQKNSARISTIVFSILLTVMALFGLLTSIVIAFGLPQAPAEARTALVVGQILMAVVYLIFLGVGIWWVVFLTRSKVKEQFLSPLARNIPLETGWSSVVPAAALDPIAAAAPKQPARPLSIAILAWIMVVAALLAPAGILLHTPAALFTKILNGWQASLFIGVYAVAQAGIGTGLLRLKLLARPAAIAFFVFGMLNALVFNLAPGAHERMATLMENQYSLFPWMRSFQNQALQFNMRPFQVAGLVSGMAMMGVAIYFLITRKQAFENAATKA